MALPPFWCSSWCSLSSKGSERYVRKNSGSQQIEPSSAIHLTLDGLKTIDLPFHLAVAPWSLDSRQDSRVLVAVSKCTTLADHAAPGREQMMAATGRLITGTGFKSETTRRCEPRPGC